MKINASMVKLVNTRDLKSLAFWLVGSSPTTGTNRSTVMFDFIVYLAWIYIIVVGGIAIGLLIKELF